MHLTVYTAGENSLVPGLSEKSRGAALVALGRSRGNDLQLAVCERATEPGHRDFCFADRVREAASTLLRKGRPRGVRVVTVPADSLTEVAFWDDAQGVVKVLPGREKELHRWLGSVAYRNDLEATDSAQNARQEARRDMRRAFIQGRPDKATRIMREHGINHW